MSEEHGDFHGTPVAPLQRLPRDAIPITMPSSRTTGAPESPGRSDVEVAPDRSTVGYALTKRRAASGDGR